MKRPLFLAICILAFNTNIANATPAQVVIIRHADKWPDSPGKTLNPTCYLRAVKFAEYYIKQFKELSDFLFASGAFKNTSSLRPIQTLTPLAGHKEIIKRNIKIDHSFTKGDEEQLASNILNNKQYDKKNIVICWQRGKIGKILSYLLGSEQKVTWKKTNYDSVYILNFKDKKTVKTTSLDNQYPVPQINNWDYFLVNK